MTALESRWQPPAVPVDVRLLRYFLAVADELHFGRAASALYVSQPALSQQIRKLETDLGAELFVRDRRSVALTDPGMALLAAARAVVEASQAFDVAARRAVRAQRRELAVGFLNPWPDGFLPRVLRRFRETHPHVTVDVRQYDFRDSTLGLRSGEMDVALLHLPLSWAGAVWAPVATAPRTAMVADDLPIAAAETVTMAELVATGLPWVTPPPEADPAWRDFWSAAPERAALGADLDRSVSPLTPAEYFSQVATGAAIGLVDAMIEPVYWPPGVRFVPVADLSPSQRVVGWRRDDDRAEVQEMVRTILAVADVMPGWR